MPYYEILLPNTQKKGTADMLLSAGRGTQKPESYKQSNGQFFMPHQGPEGQIKTTFFSSAQSPGRFPPGSNGGIHNHT